MSVSMLAAIPGVVLANQEWQIVPTDVYWSEFHIIDHPVSNSLLITYSFAIAGLLTFLGVSSLIVGFRNWRNNRTLRELPP